ncbi:ABC transporter ATP-binding protein [Celeribacter sp.]|uniref:ABC transporter ATP-binding protein n=1 Tax=Celeribacter sp. TaxID=1890673 RepID=UPI003A9159A6
MSELAFSAPPARYAIEAVAISKHFGAFSALDSVSLRVTRGRVHALLGENGAGKSTLVKCLLGYYVADDGAFLVDGAEFRIAAPADADRLGIGMVYQHFTLVPAMTVTENLVIARREGHAVIDWRAERREIETFMADMPFQLPLDTLVGELSTGERQKAEILRQLYLKRRYLVLDEPTSTLTPQEATDILTTLRALTRDHGMTIIIITHKMGEVLEFADEVSVLRKGRMVGGGKVAEQTEAALTAMLIGEKLVPDRIGHIRQEAVASYLVLDKIKTAGRGAERGLYIDHLEVYPGEILGVAGVSGNGQGQLVDLFSETGRPLSGQILVGGKIFDGRRDQAEAQDVRIIPEEPLRNACAPDMSLLDNLSLRMFDRDGSLWGLLSSRKMRRHSEMLIKDYGVRAPSIFSPIRMLSGGNVQRAVLARELEGRVRLLVVSNPCFGLDISAAAEIRARITKARNAGSAVLLLSEDLDEIMEMSDRIVVMHAGRITHEVATDKADAQRIGHHMVGGSQVAHD